MSPAVEAGQGQAMQAEQQQQEEEEEEEEDCNHEKGVLLEPFVHQVGGHSCVLRFSEQTICKPLIPRENQFYKSLPAAVKKFTPQYRGEVSVSFEEDGDGNLCLIAYPLHGDHGVGGDHGNKDPLSADCEPKSKKHKWGNKAPSAALLLDNDTYSQESWVRHAHKDKSHKREEDVELEWLQKAEVLHFSLESGSSSASAPQLKHNPWSLKCHQQHLQRMKENAKHRSQYKFILLENLTWRHTMPCVLDLKMGTRQHGDDASEEKKALQIRKCQQSTSASIGVRLCGMQVYQSDSGQLTFMNKYHGRDLTLPGFKEALFQFFHDGLRLRRDVLSPVLRKLRDMQAALEDCESYRFYSSSLLIIYDGEPPRTHTTHRGPEDRLSEEEEEEEEEVEEEEVEEEEEEEEEAGAFGFPHSSGSSSVVSSNSCSSGNSGSTGAAPSGMGRHAAPRPDTTCPVVDVRMIDFAHTTCRHYGEDSVVHEGQDSGYIFGLQNLVSIISQLEDHSTD